MSTLMAAAVSGQERIDAAIRNGGCAGTVMYVPYVRCGDRIDDEVQLCRCGDRIDDEVQLCMDCRAKARERSPIKEAPASPSQKQQLIDHIAGCKRRRANYVTYLKDRVEDEDMHGASDAANDIRELDAEIRTVEWWISTLEGPR